MSRQFDEEGEGSLTNLTRRSRTVSGFGVAFLTLLTAAAAQRPASADDVTLKDGTIMQNVLAVETPDKPHTLRVYTAPATWAEFNRDDVEEVVKKPAIIASKEATVPAGGATIETTKYGADLAFPAAAQIQPPKGSEITLPDAGGTLKVQGKASIRVPEASQVGLPKGALVQYENGLAVNLPADVTVPMGPKDTATLQPTGEEATLTFTGKATVTTESATTVTMPASAGVKVPGPARIKLPGGVKITPYTELAPAPEAPPTPPAPAPATWTAPADVIIRMPPHGATVALPNAGKVTVPGNSIITVPAGGAQLTLPPNTQLKVTKPSKLNLPKNSVVIYGSGLKQEVEADAELDVDESDRIILPPKDTQIQLPEATKAATHRSTAEIELPAGTQISVKGGAQMPVPKDAVVTPKTAPPTPTTGAPTTAPPKPADVYAEVDGMLGTGAAEQFFRNVDRALAVMLDGLKENRVLQEDPRFWLRLGMLYGSTGQRHVGDWNLTPKQKEEKVLALACFNRACRLDPSMSGSYYSPANVTLGQASQSLRNYVMRESGLSEDRCSSVDVKVNPDGTIALKN